MNYPGEVIWRRGWAERDEKNERQRSWWNRQLSDQVCTTYLYLWIFIILNNLNSSWWRTQFELLYSVLQPKQKMRHFASLLFSTHAFHPPSRNRPSITTYNPLTQALFRPLAANTFHECFDCNSIDWSLKTGQLHFHCVVHGGISWAPSILCDRLRRKDHTFLKMKAQIICIIVVLKVLKLKS